MNAGALRHLVIIEANTPAQAGDGQMIPSWSQWEGNPNGVYASIEPLSGREFQVAKGYSSTVSHKITLRFVPGVTTRMRINGRGRVFAINAILDDQERDRSLTLYCTEKV